MDNKKNGDGKKNGDRDSKKIRRSNSFVHPPSVASDGEERIGQPDRGLANLREGSGNSSFLKNLKSKKKEEEDPQSRFAVGDEDWVPFLSNGPRRGRVQEPYRLYESERVIRRTSTGIFSDPEQGVSFLSPKTPLMSGQDEEKQSQMLESDHDWDDVPKSSLSSSFRSCFDRYGDPTRMYYYLPILSWAPKYSIKDLPSDILAGLAIAMLLIPQGIAYAIIAGLSPNYGLYAGIVPLFMYVLFGTCPQLAVGPEGVISMLLAQVVEAIKEKECGGHLCDSDVGIDDLILEYMFALAFLCGLMCLILGLVRAGFFANIISNPVLNGFISASALIIMGSQLNEFFGFCSVVPCDSICTSEEKEEGMIEYVDAIERIAHGCTNWWAVLIGCGSIILFLGFEAIKSLIAKRFPPVSLFPSTFVVIILGIMVGYFGELDECCDVRLLGDVKSGAPPPSLPRIFNIARVQLLIPHTVIIVLVGFVEATAVAKIYGSKHRYSVSPNRELIAFGMCNVVGSFFSSYPVFSSLPRSRVADMAGARTTLSGLVAGLITLLSALFVMPLFKYLPYACVSGVIICAAAMLVEVHDILNLIILRAWAELLLAVLIFLITFILGPQLGIGASLLISLFLIVRRSTSLELMMLTPSGDTVGTNEVRPRKLDDGITIIRLDESLHFGNTTQLRDIIRRIEMFGAPHIHPSAEKIDSHSPLRGLIIHMKAVSSIDAESVSALRDIITEFQSRNIFCYFVHLQQQPKRYMYRGGLFDSKYLDRETCVHNNLAKALEMMRQEIEKLDLNSSVDYVDMNDVPLSYSGLERQDRPSERREERGEPSDGEEREFLSLRRTGDGDDEEERKIWASGITMSFGSDSLKKLNIGFKD